jgi:uncharacterized protein YodC (DUF2158 family)
MKKFTTTEIVNLLNQVYRGEISFSQMVEVINERVNEIDEPQYKDGDFVVNKRGDILIFKKKDENKIYDHAFFNNVLGLSIAQMSPSYSPIRRHATEAEKQILIDALEKEGKRWNAEKKCIEDIPKRKFKKGDKVRIKDGISSKTHYNAIPAFVGGMDKFIGKELTVENYSEGGFVIYDRYYFSEDWLEPYVEDIPKRKFRTGDKVKIKDGISSKTHCNIYPWFLDEMDDLIGKTMTVDKYTDGGKYVACEETESIFREDWLEPYVEDIPKCKFNVGDKVVLKSGYKKSDKLIYLDVFDLFIGKKITVAGYTDIRSVFFSDCPYIFDEDWLEPYEELKEGDLAIFWDDNKDAAVIGKYSRFTVGQPFPHSNHRGDIWKNAIKFESKEQYKKLLKGEI